MWGLSPSPHHSHEIYLLSAVVQEFEFQDTPRESQKLESKRPAVKRIKMRNSLQAQACTKL